MSFSPLVKNLIGGSIFLGFAGLILYPAMMSAKLGAQRYKCASNLKAVALACAQYRRDSDGFFPAISRGEKGWADALQPYAKSWEIFQCPAARKTSKTRRTDYFYNARLSNIRSVRLPPQTILFGDGDDNRGANSSLSELPLDWRNDDDSPGLRHVYGATYAFTDGHVRWGQPDKISVPSPSNDLYDWKSTFAVR